MSTPRTDVLAAKDFIPDGLWIAHSRVLERENAELRSEKNLWEAKCLELIAPHYILDPDLRAQKFRDALAYHPVLSRPTITVSHPKSFLPPNNSDHPRGEKS
jgi:hypothetical protein